MTFVPSALSKARLLVGGSSQTSSATVTTDRSARPFSMASSVTVVPPSPLPPAHAQPSTLATLQYQQALMADFWSGSAARAPSPPTSTSHTVSSHGSAEGRKTKWAHALRTREEKQARREETASEPKTLARLLFLFGFLFPLLWAAGASLLFFPTKPRVEMDSLPVHATEERERRVARYRKAEEKWAKRSLWAWMCLLGVVAIIVIGVVVAKKSSS